MKKLTISNIPEISAIYYALLKSGYDYYTFEIDEELLSVLNGFGKSGEYNDYFKKTRQSGCKVYPYWPRAAMLETAVFFLNDKKAFYNKIMSATNIANDERNQEFWHWIEDFPNALSVTMRSDEFKRYFDWETEWIECQNSVFCARLEELRRYIDICTERYGAVLSDPEIVVNPIKCAYSSDYHIVENRFICTSGRLDIKSVLHEYLHHIVHPKIELHKARILNSKCEYPEIDETYYLSGDENGQLNAFEEYAVRLLTDAFFTGNAPSDMDDFLLKI